MFIRRINITNRPLSLLKNLGSDLAVTIYPSQDSDLNQGHCVFTYLKSIGIECVYISKHYTEFERLRYQAYAKLSVVFRYVDTLYSNAFKIGEDAVTLIKVRVLRGIDSHG